MAACEQCWEKAAWDVMVRGGSQVERYRARLGEHFHDAATAIAVVNEASVSAEPGR